MNKNLPAIYLNAYKCYHLRINGIKNNNFKKKISATFYYFSKPSSSPKYLSTKLQWQEVYSNFRLQQSMKNTTNINKRKIIQNTENSNQAEHQNDKNAEKKITVDKIIDYFNSPEALILFNCRDNEMVDDYLS